MSDVTAEAAQRAPFIAAAPAEERSLKYGSRLQIGMIIPSVASNAEGHITAMLPDGVTLHTTRVRMDERDSESMLNFIDSVEEAASLLKDARCNHILVNCTAVTTADPSIGKRIAERILSATGLPASTTGDGVVAALRTLGARKVVMLTPYRRAINEREVRYLELHGFEVVDWEGLELYGAKDFDKVTPADWRALVNSHRHAKADVYFVSCAQVRVVEVIDVIERDMERPVITSNQAATWHVLRQRGIQDQVPGFGSLLRM